MADLFDFDTRPDEYAVMGNPVAHSQSPRIHALFAQQTGQRVHYSAIHVDLGGFAQAVGNFAANGGKGLNITVPFKGEAFALADELSERAGEARAVNTFVCRRDGYLIGDNTDGVGLVRDLTQNHAAPLAGKRVLLLGAGGAARGVLGPLLAEGPAELHIANRTADRAEVLAEAFAATGRVRGGGYGGLQGAYDLIINATSASLGGELPPLPDDALAPGGWCYDMMYGKEPTPFLRWAAAHGAAQALDGVGMLVEQAAESFSIWRKVRPATAPVIAALRAGA
ncbi:shikimate dehydrogenase [Ectothiorhodospiraceae bacterium 2226]|nr:shikimate dehydrogenase [Ectothiorhodospiraceae bacterium 2226]